MAQKALVEEAKFLNKVKEEKEKNQSLSTKQLATLVVCRNAPLRDWQENDPRLCEQYDESTIRTLMLSYSVCCFLCLFFIVF